VVNPGRNCTLAFKPLGTFEIEFGGPSAGPNMVVVLNASASSVGENPFATTIAADAVSVMPTDPADRVDRTQASTRLCNQTCPSGTYRTRDCGGLADKECTALTLCVSGVSFESVSPNATADRVCTPYLVCAADEFIRIQGTATTDNLCFELSVCAAGEFVSTLPSLSTDRACSDCEQPGSFQPNSSSVATTCTPWQLCGAGTIVGIEGTAQADRTCVPCPVGEFQSGTVNSTAVACTPQATCGLGERVVTLPTPSTDRGCGPCPADSFQDLPQHIEAACTAQPLCGPGTSFALNASAPLASVRVCSACAPSTYQNTNLFSSASCAACSVGCPATFYEDSVCVATSDRSCTIITVCDNRTQFQSTAPTPTTDASCSPLTVCDLSTQFISQQPTPNRNRLCQNHTQCAPGR
jgi:hypothetical protein